MSAASPTSGKTIAFIFDGRCVRWECTQTYTQQGRYLLLPTIAAALVGADLDESGGWQHQERREHRGGRLEGRFFW